MKKRDVYMLIDSHALIHRAYHAIPYLQTKDGRPSGALFGLSNILLGAIEKFKPDYIFAANDLPKTTFREMAFKSYKAHRTKTEDFLVEQIVAMPDLFKNFGIPLLSQEGYEADDVIGTLVCKIQKEKTDYQVVILTGDMDIMQLIDDDRVVVYTAKKGEEEIIYHEEEVMKKYGLLPKQIPDYKGLRGDTSDNIPGIKGIGEKTAMQILQKGGTLKKVYELIDSGKDEEYFEITKRMFELLKNGKEDAEFSRELATINCDIEIDIPQNGKFVLKDHIHDLKDYCEDYGFVSIKRRLEKLENIGQKSGARKKDGEDEKIEMLDYFQENTQAETQTEVSVNKNETINFTPETFKKVQLALWLLDSSETNIDQERANYLTKKWGAKNEDEVLDRLVEELKTKNLEELYFEMELPLIEILNEANRVGIKVDREKLQKLLQKYEKEKDILVEEIYKQAGQTFNINSPKQLGEILFEKLEIQGEGVKDMVCPTAPVPF
jgi:DNA polymerase-1